VAPRSFRYIRKAAFDETVNATMYLRKIYSIPTRLTRKGWARRKHAHSWLYSSNVLKDWAKSYRLYKNHNKSVLNQLVTSDSYVAFNLVSLSNSLPCLHKGSEDFTTASFTRRILKYFGNYSALNPRLRAIAHFGALNLVFISCAPETATPELLEPKKFLLPLLTDSVSEFADIDTTPQDEQLCSTTDISELLHTLFDIWIMHLKSVYAVLTLLSRSHYTSDR